MGNNKYYDEVLAYLTQHGATGVNKLSDALNIPLTNMQRYLTGQSYFKKTEDRKWDLPQNVNADIKSDTMTLMVTSVENQLMLIRAQMADVAQSIDNTLMPIETLKRGVKTILAPVATKSGQIDPQLVQSDKKLKDSVVVFNKFIDKCPEEYQDLIKNLDLVRMTIELGTLHVNGAFNREITSLFLEKSTEISEEVLSILKTYQKDDIS